MGASDRKTKLQFRGTANVDVQLRRDLRRHAACSCAGRIVTRWKQVESEAPFGVADRGVACASRRVYDNDGGLRDSAAGGVKHGAADLSGGGVLRGQMRGGSHDGYEKNDRHDEADARWRPGTG